MQQIFYEERWEMGDGKMGDGKMGDGRWEDERWEDGVIGICGLSEEKNFFSEYFEWIF
jgi:hypothetical protein